MEGFQQLQRPRNAPIAYGPPNNIGRGWGPFPAMRRPDGWDSAVLEDRNGPLRSLESVPATRPWTEREDQLLFDASLRREGLVNISQSLNRGLEETSYRLTAHTNETFRESRLPSEWMRPYFTVLNELRRDGREQTPWSAEEEEELMLFAINGYRWIDPLVFEDDRTADGTYWRMAFVTGPVEPYRSRFEALRRREEAALREFQEGMTDQEWRDLGLMPPLREVEEEGNEEDRAGGVPEGPQGAQPGWHEEGGEHGVVVIVLDD